MWKREEWMEKQQVQDPSSPPYEECQLGHSDTCPDMTLEETWHRDRGSPETAVPRAPAWRQNTHYGPENRDLYL